MKDVKIKTSVAVSGTAEGQTSYKNEIVKFEVKSIKKTNSGNTTELFYPAKRGQETFWFSDDVLEEKDIEITDLHTTINVRRGELDNRSADHKNLPIVVT